MITFENIIKKYGSKEVLKGISSDVPKGKITSLIGPNGAGKSTLLSIMSRLLTQDKGSVFFMEKDLGSYKNNELAKYISILKQSNHLELKLTVKDK